MASREIKHKFRDRILPPDYLLSTQYTFGERPHVSWNTRSLAIGEPLSGSNPEDAYVATIPETHGLEREWHIVVVRDKGIQCIGLTWLAQVVSNSPQNTNYNLKISLWYTPVYSTSMWACCNVFLWLQTFSKAYARTTRFDMMDPALERSDALFYGIASDRQKLKPTQWLRRLSANCRHPENQLKLPPTSSVSNDISSIF